MRFRHTDTDLVRNARQQDFIRWAKDQYGVSQLFSNRIKLLRIFGKHAQTDHSLHTSDGLIDLFDLVLSADGSTIQQYKFPAILPGPCSRRAVLRHRGAGRGAAGLRHIHDAHAQAQGEERRARVAKKKSNKKLNKITPPGSPRTCPTATARPPSWPS